MIKILFVGNLTKAKGLDDLLSVFYELRKKYKNINLIICGDGNLGGKLNLEGVIYKGLVNYSELPKVYRRADIFVAPSKDIKFFGLKIWEEYFSYTLMEAQAASLPIIATNSGGISEEIDKRNYIIPQGDRCALYNALESLILDPVMRVKLGGINRKRAEKFFDARLQAEKTEQVILPYLYA